MLQISQNLDLDLRNQTFILLFPYVWNPFKNILMTFETFLMMSITTERYLATRNPLEYHVGRVTIIFTTGSSNVSEQVMVLRLLTDIYDSGECFLSNDEHHHSQKFHFLDLENLKIQIL